MITKKCLNCNKITANPKFCCQSCAAKYNVHILGNGFKKGNQINLGKVQSIESNLERSKKLKGRKKPPFTKLHIENLRKSHLGLIPGNKGWDYSKIYTKKERKIKFGFKNKGKRAWNKDLNKETDKRIAEQSKKQTGKKLSKEHCKNIGKASKKKWKDPIYREKTIKAIMKGKWKRPTSLEKIVIDIIQKYNLSYRYTGNGIFLIGENKSNPDFIHKTEKICVEVYGGPWHPKNYERIRGNYFFKYGWKTIFINEQILNNEALILKKLI